MMFSSLVHVYSQAGQLKVILKLKLANLSHFECDMVVCGRQAGLSPSVTLIDLLRFKHTHLSGNNKTEKMFLR